MFIFNLFTNQFKEYPKLTHEFIEYFSKQNFKNKTLLEIGSGESTLYWEKKFKKVISYEHDLEYFSDIKKRIKKKNTEIYLFDKNIFSDEKFLNSVKTSDYIIIDNNPNFISRYDFSVFCTKNMKKNSFIILDNGLWNLDAYNYLINNFFVKDFCGLNKENRFTVTSLFYHEKRQEYYHY